MNLIAATILFGPDASGLKRAFASAEAFADHVCLVDSGVPPEVIKEMTASRNGKVSIEHRAWNGSYADARNFALSRARAQGSSFALTVDSDQWLIGEPQQLRHCLKHLPEEIDLILCRDASQVYHKERLIRCSSAGSWLCRL